MRSSPREQQQLHIYFFPLMAPGHMIPVVDIARQFARHDPSVKATIVLPHLNVPQFQAAVDRDIRNHGSSIRIVPVTFPTAQVGLPDDCYSLSSVTSPDMGSKFNTAVGMLRSPSEHLLRLDPPDCIVSDFYIPWTAPLAADLRVPRIIVHVSGFFPLCVHHSLAAHDDWRHQDNGDDVVRVPGLPDDVTMTRPQLTSSVRSEKSSNEIVRSAREAELSSYGAVFNTFEELEPGYAEHYKKNIGGSKVWHVGPASLCNAADKAQRGSGDYCLDWLSTKEAESVMYVCFGTMSLLSAAQVHEIASGLESCGQDFVWAIKNGESLLPEGFEERVGERGLVLQSWAPQLLILEHGSVGGFLTHCGWNSLMEGVCAGKPMLTWPITFEQFENEKLLTDILKIGVAVGCAEWSDRWDVGRGLIKGEELSKAVNRVMVGEERVEMKKRVVELGEQARKAVEKGGSSYNDLDSLLGELWSIKDGKINVVV